ncbi:unnamed protein product [Phytomonas sp. Hart1]|nr:unnamed protein product [Phytomonas sp. Hart1]|eukprot:CCW67946.1 unnamed protein product [Phytomonas sp. isolate Hart1]
MSSGNFARQVLTGPGLVDSLSNLIIRPPRDEYTDNDLKQEILKFNDNPDNIFFRHDIELQNMRGLTIQCSWYKPVMLDEHGSPKAKRRPCVIYCHGNRGNRLNALEAINVLESGFTLFAFDFCGCGKSDGEYISLGHYERQDLAAVVEYLRKQVEEVSSIAIWGRSMGAVTAIMYAARDPSINCIVCDSPFSSLKELIDDLVIQYTAPALSWVSNFIVSNTVKVIRRNIVKRAMFDIDDIDTVKFARDCKVPTMLIHGEDDDFVLPEHSKRVYDAFKGLCIRMLDQGGHNDERALEIYKKILDFITQNTRNEVKREGDEPCEDSDIKVPPILTTIAES